MSFLTDLRQELCALPLKKNCCKKAILWGMLCGKGELLSSEEQRITLTISGEIASFASFCMKEFTGKEPEESKSGKISKFSFHSRSAAQFLQESSETGAFLPKCPECRNAFFRGVFLSCGRMDDPERAYRIEFVPCPSRRNAIRALLTEWFEGHYFESVRREELLFVLRNGAIAEELLARLGANEAIFRLINIKIKHQIKNDANRLANSEAKNIEKVVEGAAALNSLVAELEKRGLLSSLPPELEAAARLRLEHPESSISQLCLHTSEPISKSGMNHRLQKLKEYGSRLLQGK